ncbi:SusC/RagA family protein [Chitinophaga caeni]|uniref:SusC/RagA family protein n=1 Tax=Chitinophaga caeni TaxID=2029983 RepID=A0A291QVP8_9BACT|nr:SusC/RagA family TonB-linked outer membrane protein [Chitinophaga caeni]ATL48036.1 SusC/RagA family protein [Chitinophaga caeni]
MKRWLSLLLLTCFAALCSHDVSAQEKKWVTGTVKDTTGTPVIFARVHEKGTANQVPTDEKGAFRIQVADGATLEISSMGYESAQVIVGQGSLNITLQYASKGLNEVVVTALGISREKKAIGYSMQEVKGGDLVNAREVNVTNALSGKVAGLQVMRSSNGPAGSSKILLRGNNSLTGDNQPLIVVDGVPINNASGGLRTSANGTANVDMWEPGMDAGNGLSDINPNDIENVSVLKGPAAAALYGSRAGNGVILITTKTGRKTPGLGITVTQTNGFESLFLKPEIQSTFGQGESGAFNAISNQSWGEKISGQTVTNWAGEQVALKAYDNFKNFYNSGNSTNTGVVFQQQINKSSLYTSMNYLKDNSMIPGSELGRLNLTTRAVSRFGKGDRWTTDMKVQYINSKAHNRPVAGLNDRNPARILYGFPSTLDIGYFKKNKVDEFGNMIWYNQSNQLNPYWNSVYNLNDDNRNRFIMSGSIKYQFTDWLDAEVRGGGDLYNTQFENKRYGGAPGATNGSYSIGKENFSEVNYSTLITAKKDNLFGKFGGSFSLGGNLMHNKYSYFSNSAANLQVPNLFKIDNVDGNIGLTDVYSEYKINSAYGMLSMNYDGVVFLDITGRNDWSSTLSKANRSFFYPSVSLSYLITESIKSLPSWWSYGKVRASYAAVGNSLQPYQLFNTYDIGKSPSGPVTAGRKTVLYDPNVRSELIKSWEFGGEFRFVNNRIGLDVTYYKSNATRQLIDLPMDPGSGYESRKINAGDIQNEGVELMLDAKILDNPTGLSWNLMANFSRNRNTVKDILSNEDVKSYRLGGYENVSIIAEAGQLYGQIYGTKYQRVTDEKSEYYGQLLLNNGLPQATNETYLLGNQMPKALLGITNSFAYKGFTFSFLVDARFGGEIFSGSQSVLQYNGLAAETVKGGARDNFVVGGVVSDGSGGYTTNTEEVTPQQYYQAINGGNIGIIEANIYDATNVRLRNIQLNYQLPKSMAQKIAMQGARIGVSCTNVWMISSHMKGIDPESIFATGTNATGFENSSPPTTRAFYVNLGLSF